MDVHEHGNIGSNGNLAFELTDDEFAKLADVKSSKSSLSSSMSLSSSLESKDGSISDIVVKDNEKSLGEPHQTYDMMLGEGYDPKRIPASIFIAKPTNPTDWSVASNESLFSIHLGNNSFSRDHFFAMYKSGELPRLDESATGNVPKLQTVMEADTAGRDSTVTEHELEHDHGKEEIPAPLVGSEASIPASDGASRTSSQDKMCSSGDLSNSNSSSIVSFQYLLTENDKRGLDTLARIATRNQTMTIDPERQLQQQEEEVQLAEAPKRSTSTPTRSWLSFFSLRCCRMG